ncbi:hypothetical protein Achl_4224 (plasmid) [Pseudarthrobacter chlorophenolicus A6]|uniref:Uncharacterized protein n=1 Tax=Pseudarthrobacter chlorophenolicus (strain ATCC 700700 / DSM 12829 / CIP 107037 / JCM 12360 / KCTC 9906 / NCIMB 13794 / A6) TaxID=452863 RepID=B8HIC8_PSECP|nr:hypothetical protein [Pseudarthrobacter chlorophenolicus]ACL42175.1 hypothetical protein Achl_4224 [Pseudarthrobacter chlorophenolicus A6]SDQ14429.1 hypothetical protein SAMN04489738_0282 [Pseudarthrobacter chlorophenolicus]
MELEDAISAGERHEADRARAVSEHNAVLVEENSKALADFVRIMAARSIAPGRITTRPPSPLITRPGEKQRMFKSSISGWNVSYYVAVGADGALYDRRVAGGLFKSKDPEPIPVTPHMGFSDQVSLSLTEGLARFVTTGRELGAEWYFHR